MHGDLCGSIEPVMASGNKYLFLIINDYNRVMWVYFLRSKSEAFDMFKKYRAQVKKGTNKQVKVFRSDREGEFSSKEFVSYFEENGIERHYIAPLYASTKERGET